MTQSVIKAASMLSLAALVLSSCAEQEAEEDQPAPEPVPVPAEVATVPTTDELGNFLTPVSGLALWEHPSIPFESTVIAANGAAGLIMISYESEPVTTLPGEFNSGVTVSYVATPQGSRAVIAARDDTEGRIRMLRTTLDPVEMSDWPVEDASGFLAGASTPGCLVKSASSNQLALVTVADNNEANFALAARNADGTLVFSEGNDLPANNLARCASDDRSGTAYLLSDRGQISTLDIFSDMAEPEPFVTLPAGEVVELAVIMQGETGGQVLAMVSSGAYVIYVYDITTAEPLGAFTLGEFSDINAVESISAFTADASNFGGLYREGTIAIVEGEESRALKLAPWTAVGNILELPDGPSLSRRDIGYRAQASDDSLIIELPALSAGDG